MSSIAKQYDYFRTNRSQIKSYYSQQFASGSSISDILSGITSSSSSSISNKAVLLSSAADKLSSPTSSLFVKNEDGSYDMDAIASAVSGFVDSYNSVKSAFNDENSPTVLQQGVNMVNITSGYENQLNKVGITINNDNSLSVDTDALKSADAVTVKSLFNGTYSFAGQISKIASQVKSTSAAASFATYSSSGISSYFSPYTTGSIFNMLI